jgi:hypothetical protein
MASNYGLFGKPFKGFAQEDPVDACMPDRFLDAPWNYNLGNCKQLMAQRCSNNWDNKCQIYASNIDDVTVLKQFFESMANHRFCNLSDKSNCSVVCEPFNPIAQTSPNICNTMGVDAMVDISQSIDTGMYNPVKLSPVYMGGCMKKCDKIEPSEITDDDYSINSCLQLGFCGETLTNICKIADEKGQTLQNSLLKQYCDIKRRKSQPQKQKTPEQQPQPKESEHPQLQTKTKTSNDNLDDVKPNESYSNNIGVFSVIFIITLLSIFMINYKK